jgi:hypothetical protein
MKFNSNSMLEDLMADTRKLVLEAKKLENLPAESINRQPGPGKWSVAQILWHLNYYSNYYLPVIKQKLSENKRPPSRDFSPGWLGNYFTNLMKPATTDTVTNKMSTTKYAVPPAEVDAQKSLQQFIADQHQLLDLLNAARSANLNKIRVPISISKVLSLKLGDTFRFFVMHEKRHFIQINNTLKQVGEKFARIN